jgi:putative membrane protein
VYRLSDRFNWRVAIVRLIANGLAIAFVVLVIPKIKVDDDREVLAMLWLALIYGVLNALVRPVLNLMLVPFLVQTYGLVMILVNIIVFGLLAWASGLIVVDEWWAVVVGGVLLSLVSWLLEGVLGVTKPVVPDDGDEVMA